MDNPSLFYISIQGVLKSWTALQLAVSHGFGGSHSNEKAQWLVGVIEDYFNQNDDLEQWELEDFLTQLMNEEFDMILEDQSLAQVSKQILDNFSLWSSNSHNELRERIKSLPQVNIGECVGTDQASDNEMDCAMPSVIEESEMNSLSLRNSGDDASTSKKSDDNSNEEEGWTMVTRSRTKRK